MNLEEDGSARTPILIGWREWVALPDLSIRHIRAKIDTGARTSALHVDDSRTFERDGETWVWFQTEAGRRRRPVVVEAEARVVDQRMVRSSSGEAEERLVITTTLEVARRRWPIELTLTRRVLMKFPMLLGRQALAGRVTIDPGGSYLQGRPRRTRTSGKED